MSGTVSQFVQQQVPTNFAAWLPPLQMPEVPNGPPNFISQNVIQFSQVLQRSQAAVVDAWWRIPDPPPTLPPLDALNIGAGATFTIFHPVWLQDVVLPAWTPPDPPPTYPKWYGKTFTPPAPPGPPAPTAQNLAVPPHNVALNGAAPVYLTTNSATLGAVPRAGAASVVVNGGAAVVAIVGPVNGGFIINGDATAQNVTAEALSVDMTAPPLAGDAYAFGTTFAVATSSTWNLPAALAPGAQVWVNAVTSGHRFTVVVW